MENPVLFLVLRGMLVVFAHWVWCWQWVCLTRHLLCLDKFPVPTLLRVVIINGCCILSCVFLHLLIGLCGFTLQFVHWWITFIDLWMLYLTRIPACRIRFCGCNMQIHMDYRIPVEKKGWHGHSLKRRAPLSTSATLSRGEHLDPCLDRLLLLFWAHYIEDSPYLLCTGSLYRKQRRGCC